MLHAVQSLSKGNSPDRDTASPAPKGSNNVAQGSRPGLRYSAPPKLEFINELVTHDTTLVERRRSGRMRLCRLTCGKACLSVRAADQKFWGRGCASHSEGGYPGLCQGQVGSALSGLLLPVMQTGVTAACPSLNGKPRTTKAAVRTLLRI
jgi:hypothetical protein